MSAAEIALIALALAMDAFALSICKGVSVQKMKLRYCVITGAYFGGFQMIMPILGYFFGQSFEAMIKSVDHWIAFILLGVIGFNMIIQSKKEESDMNCSFAPKEMLPLAVATSIDALAVGVTFAFLSVNMAFAVILIGVTAFTLSFVGVGLGNILAEHCKSASEIVGGIILILMGVKILFEHLM